MIPNVPMSDSGTATLGIIVAQVLRRKANTTRITSMMETTSVISTSCTEARIVVVRSTATLRWREGEIEARSTGKRTIMRSTVSIIFAAGWRETARSTER